jgi:hypothetical protein
VGGDQRLYLCEAPIVIKLQVDYLAIGEPIYTAPTVEVAQTEPNGSSRSSRSRPRYQLHGQPRLDCPPPVRRTIKDRGHFPCDDAAIKLLWLAIRAVQGWKQALGALALRYPDRIGPYIN